MAEKPTWEFETGWVSFEAYCSCQRAPRVCIRPIAHRMRNTETGEIRYLCEEGLTRF